MILSWSVKATTVLSLKLSSEEGKIIIYTYGVILFDESDSMMSIPFFLTAANTDFDDPMSIPSKNGKMHWFDG